MIEVIATVLGLAVVFLGAPRLIEWLQRYEHGRKVSMAWTFLTWTDDEVEAHRRTLLDQPNPGQYANVFDALVMSREMRGRLRGDLISSRPATPSSNTLPR